MDALFSRDLLNKVLIKLSLPTDSSIIDQLEHFYYDVVAYNEKVNLTAIIQPADFIIKHYADCLVGLNYFPSNSKVCDIGPGAGFPSIPIKIFRPDLEFTMFEAHQKKVDFINNEISLLNLKNIRCLHMRAEEAARKEYRESFDIAIARAVASLNALVEYSLPLVKIGGKFIAYKADIAKENSMARNASEILGSNKLFFEEIVLPFSNIKRTLVIYEKTHNTPDIYPREGNKPKSKPIS